MPATDLIISEYIEGSSNNKALELYNGTGAPIDLTGYQIVMFFNGSAAAGLTINLTGTVAAGEVFVLAHSGSVQAILDEADRTNGAGWFNGDDAIVLRRIDGTIVDSIGQIGFDPGTQWGTGDTSTADNTLIRDLSVAIGDTNPFDAFDPASGWGGHATNYLDDLGSHGDGPAYGITPLSADKLEGDSGTTEFTFTVTRADAALAENVSWSVGSGSGLPADADPSDFVGGALQSGIVAFAAGQDSVTLTVAVAGDLLSEIPENFIVTLGVEGAPSAQGTIRNDDVLLTEIGAIQGAGHVSALEGQTVATVGIVTAVSSDGFWIQDETPDSDNRTSDGIFVYTGGAPAAGIVAGAEVRVSGRVAEYYANTGTNAELSLTEIVTGGGGWIQLTGNTGSVAATVVGEGGLIPPTANFGDDDNGFDPATEGLDFWESLEGMLVTLDDAVASGPSSTNSFNDSQVFAYVGGTDAGLLTPNGGLIAGSGDFNPERIAIQEDDRVFNSDFSANVGDSLGDVTGVLTYDRGGYYEVIATDSFTVTPGVIEREESTPLRADQDHLTIASYNAENLTLANSAAKFIDIAEQIVNGLGSPDIIALQEIQDDNGAAGGGTVTSEATLQRLVDAINAVAGEGGPNYAWAYVTPEHNEDGGQQSGNIRQVFLYNSDRVQLAPGAVGTATEGVTVTDNGGTIDLSLAVGRIDPLNPEFENSRKPLVAEFIFNGESVFVINNHFASKIGDDPLFGSNQPPVQETEAQRLAQAEAVAAFVEQLLAINPNANVAVVGDLNDFDFSNVLDRIEDSGLENLTDLLPVEERYDYNFQGNAQQLDHILVSGNLADEAEFDILHINSEFADQTSDHDPLIARLHVQGGVRESGGNGADVIVGSAINDVLSGDRGDDILSGGDGRDVLVGGQGADVLIGGNGPDSLAGGQGDDLLTGGTGTDLFVFERRGGADIITDYQAGADVIQLGEGQEVRDAFASDFDGDGAGDLRIELVGGGSIMLLGIDDLNDVTVQLATAPDLLAG